jgi:hypothetical protein
MNTQAWRDHAACAEHPKDWWYVERGAAGERNKLAQARAICNTCPVARQCLDYAMENGERYGLWGGKSVRERRKLLKGWVITRPCAQCGTKMHITLGGRCGVGNVRYCSTACKHAAWNTTNRESTGTPCGWCGEISSGHSHSTDGYCGWMCERSAQRARFAKLMADVA